MIKLKKKYRTKKYLNRIERLENIAENTPGDFKDGVIGEYFKQGMDDGYLDVFLGGDTQKREELKQWRDATAYPGELSYPPPSPGLVETRRQLYATFRDFQSRNERIPDEYIKNMTELNRLSSSPFYYANLKVNKGYELPDLLKKTHENKHVSPIIGKSAKNMNRKDAGWMAPPQK